MLDAAGTLPPLNVTAAEAAAIAVALAALPALPFAADARSALSKVLAAMPDAERDRAEAIAGRLWLRTPEGTPRPAVARVLDEAVRRQRVVVLHYTAADGTESSAPSSRSPSPRPRGHWYLLAWCRLAARPAVVPDGPDHRRPPDGRGRPRHTTRRRCSAPRPTTPTRSACADRGRPSRSRALRA